MTVDARRRKAPIERRGEILAAAARLAMAEGLQSLTLRRVAEELGVVAGLVNHYFPAVDDLAAAAFGHAAAAERNAQFGAIPLDAAPTEQMRALLGGLLDEVSDPMSLLWLDALQASRNRPALRAEVAHQMASWQSDLARLIERGEAAGEFRTADCAVSALRILALIDGLSVQAAIRSTTAYRAVVQLVAETIARELGVRAEALAPSC